LISESDYEGFRQISLIQTLQLYKVKKWVNDRSWLKIITGVSLLGVFFVLFYFLQFSTENLAGTDGYYHIKFASLMRSQGLKPEFPWLPLTVLNAREFYDHHFLFHVLLAPFTTGNLIQGAKLASVVFASLAFLSFWWLLRNQEVPFAWLWALGLFAVSEAFLYRMNMPRAQSLSLMFLVLGVNFLLLEHYKYLTPLSFLYVWAYDGYPLMLVLSGLSVFSVWLLKRKFTIEPILYTGAGVFLGLLINPYFPHNVVFTVRHIVPKLHEATLVRVGNEWYPYDTSQLLNNSLPALAAFLSGVIALGLQNRRADSRTIFALLLTFVFGFMLFQSRRFIEYFPAFTLIFAAFAWTPWIAGKKAETGEFIHSSESRGSRYLNLPKKFSRNWLPMIVLAMAVLAGSLASVRGARDSLRDSSSADRYAMVSKWLEENTPRGERIFQTDWDDFPRLFFYNSWNTYLVGLDPTYLQIKDPELFDLWVDITQGEVESPSELIHDSFAAKFVFTDFKHDRFIARAEEDQSLVEVYRDKEAIVYQVISEE
jgi:hypothetical protein